MGRFRADMLCDGSWWDAVVRSDLARGEADWVGAMSDDLRTIAQEEFDRAIDAAIAEGIRRERRVWRPYAYWAVLGWALLALEVLSR